MSSKNFKGVFSEGHNFIEKMMIKKTKKLCSNVDWSTTNLKYNCNHISYKWNHKMSEFLWNKGVSRNRFFYSSYFPLWFIVFINDTDIFSWSRVCWSSFIASLQIENFKFKFSTMLSNYMENVCLKLLTIVPRVFSVISRPQMNHLILDTMGSTRAQNETTEPCIATTGTGSSINFGIISAATSTDGCIDTSHDVEQHPYSDATMHVNRWHPETIAFITRSAINPSPWSIILMPRENNSNWCINFPKLRWAKI